MKDRSVTRRSVPFLNLTLLTHDSFQKIVYKTALHSGFGLDLKASILILHIVSMGIFFPKHVTISVLLDRAVSGSICDAFPVLFLSSTHTCTLCIITYAQY